MIKVCVTGGSGMIGRCIKDYVDNTYDPNDFLFTYLGHSSKLNWITPIDLTNKHVVTNYFKNNKFDFIIHLAAKVGGLYKNMNSNIQMFNDNIRINQNILEACHENNINRGIFCLSSCIYPHQPSKFPMDETMINESPPHDSNIGYAYSKRMLEMLCTQYNKTYNTEYICVIPVNLYGPYDNFSLSDGHFIPMVINRFYKEKENDILSENNKFTAFGTGKPLRQFLYAPDFAKMICDILISKYYTSTEPIICCNDEEFTIKQVVIDISNNLNINQKDIKWDTTKSDGCMIKTVTNKRFKHYFPDFVFTPLDIGLQKTIKWFINNYQTIRC
tara:strand:- start:11780 stop:12769 length:990 start_codon:yes stop_codon:yes gene_type:complete